MWSANLRALSGWVVLLTLVVVALLWWQAASAQEGDESLEDPDTFAVESYSQNCAECHGVNGNGGRVPADGREVPPLRGNPDVTVAYLDLVMLTGRMPPAGDPFDNREREVFYSDAERAAMVEWMADEFDIEGELPEIGVGEVSRGLVVYSRNCAHCHGSAGAGGTAGRRAFTPRVNNRPALAIVEAIRVGPFEMPAFSEDVLSQEDVDSVVAYLAAVEEGEGTPFLGLVELNPVFASGFVGVLAMVMLASLVYLASRPVPLEELIANPEEAAAAHEAARAGGKESDRDE